ncbi:hypothetical protein BurJ1DRAFT_1310 [Burkholderiales bacterium JOSHI_001]|nr:hypothetical protein BurJ1DRAFT_1310 [Burkholderiales bacterium JOSHI_001]
MALAAMLTVAAPAAWAQASWTLQATRAHYESRETLPGGLVFNQEQGTVSGLRVEMAAALTDGWMWRASAWHQGNAVDYQGLNQLALPIRTRTDLRLTTLEVTLGQRAGWAIATGSLHADVGLAWHRIDRDIRPSVLSLRALERLSASRALAGLTWSTEAWPGVNVAARAHLAWPLHQRLKVDTFGELDTYALAPQSRASMRWQLHARWPLAAGWGLVAQLEAAQSRYGPSDQVTVHRQGRPAGVSSYPGSEQWLRSMALGVERPW